MSNILVVGSFNMDIVVPARHFPAPGETVQGDDLRMVPGGKGANQAVAAARLGARTRIMAQVGADTFGRKGIESLQSTGVDTTLIGFSSRSTGAALITVRSDGENTIVLSPGANATLDSRTALARLPHFGRDTLILLQLEIPLETVEAIARHAHRADATIILDPAPIQSLPPALLQYVDYLTPNQTEAAALLGMAESDLHSIDAAHAASARILAMGPRAVILKLGEQGCWLATSGRSEHIPGFAVACVDTTAAGDVFNAAFAVGLSEGLAPAEAARFANAASAISVTRMGAQSSIPGRAETDAFLRGAVVGGVPCSL